jgi:membrane protein involved in colicin uptake
VSSAQTAYDEANSKLGDLTNKYNTAKAAYEQAQQTEADKKAAYDQAVKDRDDKYTECKAAYEAEDVAEKELGEANQLLGDLEGQIEIDHDGRPGKSQAGRDWFNGLHRE